MKSRILPISLLVSLLAACIPSVEDTASPVREAVKTAEVAVPASEEPVREAFDTPTLELSLIHI